MSEERLQKFLANKGVASRRKAEDLIKQGRVKVNGIIIEEMGYKISIDDVVEVDGKIVNEKQKKVYIALNKPKGIISSSKDQFARESVVDLVKDIEERVYPVGRLDYDTSGLIILTNDGDFTYKMTHPSHEIDKTYIALVKGIPDETQLQNFRNGLKIDDYITSKAKIKILTSANSTSRLKITIHEGKNRQVRKMCEAIGHPVIELKRVSIGSIELGDLKEGMWRFLESKEIEEISKNI